MSFRQHFYKLVLQHIGILILVHHDIAKTILVFQQHSFIFFKKPYCVEEQIIEVHGVVFFQRFFIAKIHFVDALFLIVIPVFQLVFCRRYFLFLTLAYCPQEVCRFEFLRIQPQFLDYVFYYRFLVCRVIHCKVGAVAQDFRMLAQDPKARRVKCEDPHV